MESEGRSKELKRLGFVRKAAIRTFVLISNLYDYAKQNSGPLKSAVGTVEGAVTTVFGPVCDKFKNVPDIVLGFIDEKVDEAAKRLDEHAPPTAKKVIYQASSLIQQALEKVQNFVNEAKSKGPWAGLEYAAAEYKQVLLTQSVKAWVLLGQVPAFDMVANVAVPAAKRLSVKYNYVINELCRKGYFIFNYFPLVPVDEIEEKYKQRETEKNAGATAAAREGTSSASD